MKPFNEQIREGRGKAGLTQQELSDAVGVSVRQIKFIEAGKSFPNYKTLLLICQALNISITIEAGHPELN
ncbi:helix-turn-helix transcriptional regulator [Arachidicoccus rhizosphaerae]|uniref:helix-turn-helix transcriptional regulator n=1 Tax=Arachidicoccus rhizosphaerae TaxID=551991 RepID=UPI000B85A162|nr:helix-turn-helix transcriptional regulator [Arachidicoccus rhizosphaerae]